MKAILWFLHCLYLFACILLSSNIKAKTATEVCQVLAKKRPVIALQDCLKRDFASISIATKKQPLPIIYKQLPNQVNQQNPNILVLGGIHANEQSSFDLPMKWIESLEKKEQYLYNWLIVPAININALNKKIPTRTNINGVDVNRNFALTPNALNSPIALWEKAGKTPRHYPGPKPFSEKETQMIRQLVDTFKPDLIISIHAPLDLIDYDGLPQFAPEKLGNLPLDLTASYPGSLASYYWNIKRIAVLTIELAEAQSLPSPIQTAHIWYDLIRWLNRQYYPNLIDKDDVKQFNQAMTALSLNKLTQAQQLFSTIEDEALQMAAKNNLAYILNQQGKSEQARQIWQNIIWQQDPTLIRIIENYRLSSHSTDTLATIQTIPLSAKRLEEAKNTEEINWRLNAWQDAWRHNDKDLYFSLYLAKHSPRQHMSYKKWKKQRLTQFQQHPLSLLRLEDIQHHVILENTQAESTFKQVYRVRQLAIKSLRKKLIWQKHQGQWQIQREIILK